MKRYKNASGNIFERFKKLKDTLSAMTFSEKAEYLWEYYSVYLLVAFFVLITLAVIITSLVNTSKKVLISGVVANLSMSAEGFTYITDDYFEFLAGDEKHEKIDISYLYFSDPTDLENQQDIEVNYSKAMTLLAMVSAGTLDFAILDQSSLEYYISQEVFLDLREFLSTEELNVYADKIIWAEPEGQEMYPIAMNISDIPFMKDNIQSEGNVYFVVGGRDADLIQCRNFLMYLFNWKANSTLLR